MMLMTAQCFDCGGARKDVASSSMTVFVAVICWLLRCCTLASFDGPAGGASGQGKAASNMYSAAKKSKQSRQ
jgi:hypothetical protein